ncbi:MAG: hypothetical protein BAJATHORv1_10653 [Candidatus Thorarchaeota archaeon]|nr:MAG: hypothetical protein BAJATHORv1_10653 [Candidatus Thorarchaeota archaeon]
MNISLFLCLRTDIKYEYIIVNLLLGYCTRLPKILLVLPDGLSHWEMFSHRFLITEVGLS